MKNRVAKWIFLAIGLLVGAACFKVAESCDAITFDPSFTFGNLIGAIVTLLVAILVTSYLQRQSQDDRSEKEILLRHMDAIYESVGEFEKYREGGALAEIVTSLKKLSLQCQSIYSIIKEIKNSCEICDAVQFDTTIAIIRKLATDTPIKKLQKHAATKKCDSEVRDGIIKLTTERQSLLDTKIQEMKLQVLQAQIKINRM